MHNLPDIKMFKSLFKVKEDVLLIKQQKKTVRCETQWNDFYIHYACVGI